MVTVMILEEIEGLSYELIRGIDPKSKWLDENIYLNCYWKIMEI